MRFKKDWSGGERKGLWIIKSVQLIGSGVWIYLLKKIHLYIYKKCSKFLLCMIMSFFVYNKVDWMCHVLLFCFDMSERKCHDIERVLIWKEEKADRCSVAGPNLSVFLHFLLFWSWHGFVKLFLHSTLFLRLVLYVPLVWERISLFQYCFLLRTSLLPSCRVTYICVYTSH